MIRLKNITKKFHDLVALDDVSLDVSRGSICGVIGKSGAGKSTLIRCVNLLEKPDTGEVEIDGVNLTNLSPSKLREQRRSIGMIFQHFNLLSSKTVYENIALPLKLIGISAKQIQEIVTPLLELTELSDKKDSYPRQLSGGQRQRVAIARALVTQPKVLLCDEATSALDPKTTKSILNLLKDINKKFGITILLITHEIEVVKDICDQVAVLDEGKIVEQSSTFTLFTHPKTLIAKELIRNALKLELPDEIKARLHIESKPEATPVIRLCFIGKTSTEPLLSTMVSKFNVHFNILQANIDLVQEQTIGIMVVELLGETEEIKQGLTYLEEQGLQTEVIGYVANNA